MTERRVVHIVDDEASIRRSTSFMLKRSGYTVATFASGADFLKEVKQLEPGCILLDIHMPEMGGLQVQEALIERGIAMPVVFLTGSGDVATAVRAMKMGAVEFIEKPFEKNVVLGALDLAFSWLGDLRLKELKSQEARLLVACLSTREREVLHRLADGLANKAIALELGISPRTVEVHRANLMIKLGVHTLSEALRIAFAAGLDRSEN
ncbi:response regulator [Sphingobium sp. D43FB]|uniref:response regulator transcription factor n=1 Tax=Sphingobium sp. D43FB TaxID=2017595 RepID=UPI000BB55164|nr:response regulator [Sphingobium sp. D43FB]PBN42935.1 DNA-binding response regulator [Sphingobium sp. D43FB]